MYVCVSSMKLIYVCAFLSVCECVHVCMHVCVSECVCVCASVQYGMATPYRLPILPCLSWNSLYFGQALLQTGPHLFTHCNTLQHLVTHCNTPGSFAKETWYVNKAPTATHCNTLQHPATPCNTPQHTATHRALLQKRLDTLTKLPLQHTATHCNTLQHTGIFCKRDLIC